MQHKTLHSTTDATGLGNNGAYNGTHMSADKQWNFYFFAPLFVSQLVFYLGFSGLFSDISNGIYE